MFEKLQRAPSPEPTRSPSVVALAAVLALVPVVCNSQLLARHAVAASHEATPFSVPAGSPDEFMRAGADFARELDPAAEVSYWQEQVGSLSVSRVEKGGIRCLVRLSSNASTALQ